MISMTYSFDLEELLNHLLGIEEEEYEYDEDGVAYWYDEENEVWYWYDEESDEWYECEEE